MEQQQLWDPHHQHKQLLQQQQAQAMESKHLTVHKKAMQQRRDNRQGRDMEPHKQAEGQHQRDMKHLQYQWILDKLQEGEHSSGETTKEQRFWNNNRNSWPPDEYSAGGEGELVQGPPEILNDYYADDEGSPGVSTSQSSPCRKRFSPTMDTIDSADVSRSRSGRKQSMTESSSFMSEISACNRARTKSRTRRERSNFLSVIAKQLPSLLQQFSSHDMSKTSSNENLTELIKFLEGQKISEYLQEVADPAHKLLESAEEEERSDITTSKSQSCSNYYTDSEIVNSNSFLEEGYISPGYEHQGGKYYSARSALGREMTKSNFSESQCLSSRMTNENLTRVAKTSEPFSSKAQDKSPEVCNSHFRKRSASQSARHVPPPKEATGDSNKLPLDASEKLNLLSSTEQEMLRTGKCGLSDLPPNARIGSSGDTECIMTSGHKTSIDLMLSSSDEHYGAFLDFLEQTKVFVALQDVVDEAVHKLIKPVKEEESSALNTSIESAFFGGDKAESPVLNEANVSVNKFDSFEMSEFSGCFPSESYSSSFIVEPELQTDSDAKKEIFSFHGSSSEPQNRMCPSSPRHKEQLEDQGYLPPPLFVEQQDSFEQVLQVIASQRIKSLQNGSSIQSQSRSIRSSLKSSQEKAVAVATASTSFVSDSSLRVKFSSPKSAHVAIRKSKPKPPTVTSPKSKQRTQSLTLVIPEKPKSTSSRSSHLTPAKSDAKTHKSKHVSSRMSKYSSERKDSSHPSKELTSQERDFFSWLSSSDKLESGITCYPSTTSASFSALQYFSSEEILDYILENIIQLMIYKYKTEKSLEGKIGIITQPFTDPYLERIFQIRNRRRRMHSRIITQPLSLHEENCLASHPLWASSKTNRRFHLPWKSSAMTLVKRAELCSSSVISTEQESFPSTLPEITSFTPLAATASSHSGKPSQRNSTEQFLKLRSISRNHLKTILPKI